MRNLIWIPVIIVLALVAVVGVRLFYYGWGSYTSPARPLQEVDFESSARSARMEAVDNPTVSKGVVAIDYAHSNALFVEELNVILSKVVNRGFSYELILTPSKDSGDQKDDDQSLAAKLRYAQSLILPLPRTEYTPEEIAEIKDFVAKGGRVLIIGDPTRTVVVEALNSIAGPFGIIYANDYLYSQTHKDTNYRNVVYSTFKDSLVTKGLTKDGKVVFYGGGSVSAPGHEIILGDETTHSSVSEGGRAVASAALTTNDQVLALTDLTFMNEPYSAAQNNGTLINNVADFLTGTKRDFELKDFPFFLNPTINIVYENSLVLNSQFDNSVRLKEFLEKNDHTVTFVDKIGGENDVIYVGRFNEVERVKDYLAKGGITILGLDQKTEQEQATPEPLKTDKQLGQASDEAPGEEDRFVKGRIKIEGVGELESGGSTLFYLNRAEGRNVLVILSDTPETNTDAFELLFENRLSECRLSDTVAVCQTQEPDGELPPSLRSKRIDKILVISGNNGRVRDDNEATGVVEFTQAISSSYKVDEWIISEKESPDLDELLEYDAIIWATGNYWDDSITDEDAALLSKYIELGGNLILSGASIGFDWDHTDFLANVAHVDYLDFAEQTDVKLVLPDHPIAVGFDPDTTISFTKAPSGTAEIVPDVVDSTPNARVIFQRGPESEQEGAASIVAYEDDRSKVAYFAFPIYLLPAEQRDLIISNTIEWFTEKPLPLPNEKDFQPFEPTAPEPEPTAEPTGEPTAEPTEELAPEDGGGNQGDNSGNN